MAGASTDYEFFDHTADVGIRAEGKTLAELFIRLADGLRELLTEDSALTATSTRPIALSAPDASSLLLAWLQELLFWFSTDRFVPVAYQLDAVTPTSLRGQVRGDTFDPTRHVQGREVKAITRHLLDVTHEENVWKGQVIVDI